MTDDAKRPTHPTVRGPTIIGGTLIDNKGGGLVIGDGAKNVTVVGVRAIDNGGDGVRVEGGTGIRLDNVESIGSEGDGFRIERGGVHLTNARAINSGGSGIVIGSKSSEPPKPPEDAAKAPGEHWYKKPIGILGVSVAGSVISAAALWAVVHYFG